MKIRIYNFKNKHELLGGNTINYFIMLCIMIITMTPKNSFAHKPSDFLITIIEDSIDGIKIVNEEIIKTKAVKILWSFSNILVDSINASNIMDSVAELKKFTGKIFGDVCYLHWNITNQHQDGIYLIFKSFDNKNFDLLGQKQGIGIPNSLEIAYYYKDEIAYESAYYKLVHLSKNYSLLMSEVIYVGKN